MQWPFRGVRARRRVRPVGLAALQDFVANSLSSTYLDVIKNRLYLQPASSPARHSAQLALSSIAADMHAILTPITPLLCAEVAEHLPAAAAAAAAALRTAALDSACLPIVEQMFGVRRAVHEQIGRLKKDGYGAAPNETSARARLLEGTFHARVCIAATPILVADAGLIADLGEVLMVEQVCARPPAGAAPLAAVAAGPLMGEPLHVQIYRSAHEKCPRCWIHRRRADAPVCGPCRDTIEPAELLN